LREWLTRKQRETRRGRADLRLAERAALWAARPEARHLPAWWEWLNILLFTRRQDWTQTQHRMMRQASRHHTIRGVLAALLVVAVIGWGVYSYIQNTKYTAELVDRLVVAEIEEVPNIIAELNSHRGSVDPKLSKILAAPSSSEKAKLRASLALLPVDNGQVEYLFGRLLDAEPPEVAVLRTELAPHRAELRERLWAAAERPPPGHEGRRLRAACALAAYDADSGRWDGVREAVAADLVSVPPLHLATWRQALAPVRGCLLAPLAAVFRDGGRRESERALATDVLAEYAADRPEVLADLLMDADERQWGKLWPKVPPQRDGAVTRFTQELDKVLPPDWHDAPLDPSWGAPDPALVRQVEDAGGMVSERFALCQTLPLAQFDAVTEGLRKAGYRPLNFRPYAAAGAPAAASPLVAALWARDGCEARWAHGLTADEAMKRDAEMGGLGLVALDVAGYVVAGEVRYAGLWGPKEAGQEGARLYVGVPPDEHEDAWLPLLNDGFVPRTQTQVIVAGEALHSAVWWKPGRPPEFTLSNFEWTEVGYERRLTPSNLQTDLRLAWDPAGPGLVFAAAWIDSATQVSAEVHGLSPADHLDRCRKLAEDGYRPAALTVTPDGSGRLLAGSVWQQPVVPEAKKDELAKRQAQAAAALLQLGVAGRVWPLLEFNPDPRVRSFLIHRLGPLATDPDLLLKRLAGEPVVSRRRALLLALGAYPVDRLNPADRVQWQGRLRQWYRDETDAGLHGAVEWLMRKWKDDAEVARTEKEMARTNPQGRPEGNRGWYVNGQGQTLVVVPEPDEPFWMGSPGSETGRLPGAYEALHRVCIPRSFAIGAKEVTVEQFKKRFPNHKYTNRYSPWPDGPIVAVRWFEAAEYCNWLSEREGIPKEEWCYEPNRDGEYGPGMRLAPGALEKKGYRLPTEAEWEYACRAGTVTRRYYGDADELLGEYAWNSATTRDEGTRPGGLLKPNDWGLFDLYGNAHEWVLDPSPDYTWPGGGGAKEDEISQEDFKGIKEGLSRVLRGGSVTTQALGARSANRYTNKPTNGPVTVGFRVARTCR
jgi:formylglycine-generating enzyme required for sulfatase activity